MATAPVIGKPDEAFDEIRTRLEVPRGSGAWDWDIRAGAFRADARFAALCSMDPEQALEGAPGAMFFAAIHPEDRLRVQIAVAAALQGAEVFSRSYRLLLADGSIRWVSAHGRSYLGETDEPIRFVGILTDITEQKRVEEQLQLAQTAGGIGTFIYEQDFGTVEVSDEFCRLLGFHEADALPVSTVNSVVCPGDPLIIDGDLHVAMGDVPYTEIRVRRADVGDERWIALRGQVRREGGARRLLGAIYDITETKRVQARLGELNRTLEERVDARTRERDRVWRLSKDLICVCDEAGVMITLNPAWIHVLGRASGDLVGLPLESLVHEDDRDDLVRKLKSVTSGRPVQDFDLRLSGSDGRYYNINWSMTAQRGEVYLLGRDITKRLQLQAELLQSQKMEAVGQLTGGIAHDFNNMLTGIMGCLDIIRRRIDKGQMQDIRRFMSAAVNSAERAASLTHRLLAFSRRQSLQSSSVDVNELARSMEDLLRRTLGERVKLLVHLREDLPPALIDPSQLESAILNLAINARDAMEEGGTLTIETQRVHVSSPQPARPSEIRPGDYVRISVSDTGSGMSDETLAKAFDPFFTTKPIGKGTGLGLSMIQGFMEQSFGHVVVDSVIGEGTTVSLYLPESETSAGATEAKRIMPAPTGRNELVLLVEDDPSVRLLVLEVLQELNYEVIECANAEDALRVLDSSSCIDLLITDVGLPGLNGRQIAETARRRRPELPILLMTAYSPDLIHREDLPDDIDVMLKPFGIDELASRLRAILGLARE